MLAKAIGAYDSQISNYETGEVVPEGETLVALAIKLDVSLDELILGRTTEKPDNVRDARLRQSVRKLERLGDRHLIDVAVIVLQALTIQKGSSSPTQRSSRRRSLRAYEHHLPLANS